MVIFGLELTQSDRNYSLLTNITSDQRQQSSVVQLNRRQSSVGSAVVGQSSRSEFRQTDHRWNRCSLQCMASLADTRPVTTVSTAPSLLPL